MRSDRRLHPLSILFNIGKRFGALALPLLLIIIGAGSDDERWQLIALIGLAPYALTVTVQYFFFTYRYDASELVIRQGVIFRNQRHIPYERIQNVDAVQNVLHRLLGLVEVRLQTASGREPEAILSVLTLSDLEQMRQRVGHPRAAATGEVEADEPEHRSIAPSTRRLLRLGPRELVYYGLVENRGLIVIGAAIGLLWEFASVPRFVERMIGEQASRGFIRQAVRAVFVEGGPSMRIVVYGTAGLLVFLLVSRLFSILWALVRLHGFTLAAVGDDLRAEYGLLTRVTATIPRRRIQAILLRETWLHRLCRRTSLRVTTAGGKPGDEQRGAGQREWLAPILPASAARGLLSHLLPEWDLAAVEWRGVHPRAFLRAARRAVVVAVVASAALYLAIGWGGVWLLPTLIALGVGHAHLYVRRLGWAIHQGAVAFREGVIVQTVTVVPLAKIQVVAWHESPFDRRMSMARVRVDTAGGAPGGHRVDVPFLPVDIATGLHGMLAAEAARTAFRW